MKLNPSLLLEKRLFLERVILMILIFSCAKSDYNGLEDSTSGTTYSPVTTSQDLNDWTQIGGTWNIAGDGSTVTQTAHTRLEPYFLLSPTAYTNVIISGTVTPATSDNDFFGWVMGLSEPVDTNDTDYNFILVDWKQVTENDAAKTGQEGHCMAKVNGSFSGLTEMLTYFHERQNTGVNGKFYVLNTNYGDSEGWADNVSYTFEIAYTASKIKVAIGGAVVFEESGSFSSGKVGLYMYSQQDITFSNIQLTTNFDPSSI